jgi:uncharacterized membrane protein YfcA
MPFSAKLLLSALIATVAVGFLFVSSAGSPSWWRRGTSDPVRRALFRNDGVPRRYIKPIFVALCAVIIVLLWSAFP